MDKKILIGMPSGSGVMSIQMTQSLLMLHKPLPTGFMTVERQRIDKARNYIAVQAMKQRMDYLLFVDDDNPIPPDTLEKFIEDDKDIIIAPIPGRVANKEGVHPLCAFYKEEVEIEGKPLRLYFPIEKFRDEGPLHRIDGGGTGCMLIKLKVLDKMFEKYQDYMFEFGDIRFTKTFIKGKEYDRRTMSEDAEFCERASDLGFEIWLDERIRPFHLTGEKAVRYG